MMNRQEYMAHLGKYRTAQKKYPENLYAHIRAHIVRIYQECEKDEKCAAEKLGCSVKTVRKYLNFVPFERLMRDPAQANDFDWRSLNALQWNRLLWKYPVFFSRLPKNRLILSQTYAKILMKYPEAIQSIDLAVDNRIGCMSIFTLLLPSHPEFEVYCDFSQFEAYNAKELLCKAPRYFDRIRIDTLWPYHWDCVIMRQPQILDKMTAKAQHEWPFNFKVYYLRQHPEFEAEFHEWDKIDWVDLLDIQRDQPELYFRHYDRNPKEYAKK